MRVEIIRERKDGKKATSWVFSVVLDFSGAIGRIELEEYGKYARNTPQANWRLVGQWRSGWNSNIAWTDIRTPADVIVEVKQTVIDRVKHAVVRAGNVTLDSGEGDDEKDASV